MALNQIHYGSLKFSREVQEIRDALPGGKEIAVPNKEDRVNCNTEEFYSFT